MPPVVKLVEDLKLTDRVEFVKGTKDVAEYYSKAKIFAFTSTTEGFPNALGEALSTPLASISYDCVAGPADLIEDGVNGFLIKEMEHQDYINKLRLLMNNDEQRVQFETEAAKKIQKFNINSIGNLVYDFITKA